VAHWSVPDHLRRSPTSVAGTRRSDASDVPVWIEADELREFRAWWETLPETQRNARRAFLRGLERADAAWSAVYRSQGTVLQEAQTSVRTTNQELARLRTANQDLRQQLELTIDRASEAEERVRLLTTPLSREYE
jgi:hypothetical protein